MKLPQDTVDRLLDRWQVARFATIGPLRPHIVPVVFARVADVLWLPVDGKPKRGGQLTRVSNVSSQPRATLLIDRWDADWSRLWWLRVDVVAEVVTASGSKLGAGATAAVLALETKYPQYRQTPVLGDPPTLLRLQIDSTQSWCASAAAIASIESSTDSA